MSKVSIVAKLTARDGKRADIIEGMAPMMDHVESEEGTLCLLYTSPSPRDHG